MVPLKFILNFQDLSRRSIETGFGGFEMRLKFIKFVNCPFIQRYTQFILVLLKAVCKKNL